MKVSVALCTYNGEKYIKKQLESILQQTRSVDEIIVCDDGSCDHTLQIVKEELSNFSNVYKIIQNEKPLKVLRNFQKAFSLCTGDIIFSCDQDDIWRNDKVEKILNAFKANHHISMVATNASLIDAQGKKMNLSLKDSIGMNMQTSEQILASLLNTFCITGATMAFKKSFEEEHRYLSAYWLHDGWLALIASLNNELVYLDEELTKYRLHGNNECGVGDVDLLHHGTIEQLNKRKKKRVIKTALKCPFYFEDYAKMRKDMYEEIKMQVQSNHWQVQEDNMQQLDACIAFWQWRSNIRKMHLMECIHRIMEMKKNNDYDKYCESKHFALFDLYFYFVYKLIPRKHK
ncbi:MAG: glycosyltransferase [Erysipelotrichia bacterium]|nr:glycosyltransferase [Erysipelotrichia bacterium]